MKIDKSNWRHWWWLVLMTVNVFAGIIGRWITGRKPGLIVLYGHKLNGNLKSLYERALECWVAGHEVRYLSMDKQYVHALRENGISCFSALNLLDMVKACRAACIITDHGAHSLRFLMKATAVDFVDVWHGIPFKGFDAEDFAHLHPYRAIFVASPSMRRIYCNQYGFSPDQIVITGYGRTDRLYKGSYDRENILKRLDVQRHAGKIILIAPTWAHDTCDKGSAAFDFSSSVLVSRLKELATANQVLIIIRSHLNEAITEVEESEYLRYLPTSRFPATEELLFVSDVLVSDWSSIVFDYLVLERPTIFLDIPCPFRKGYTYGPEYRFGAVVKDLPELEDSLHRACRNPEEFLGPYLDTMASVRAEVYNGYLDGNAAGRYIENIDRITSV